MEAKTAFEQYKNLFVQPMPTYAVKTYGVEGWHTKKFPLHDNEVLAHLNQKQVVACLGRYYPEHVTIDLDNVPIKKVEIVRDRLKLEDNNSMLFTSESPNSYHLSLKPVYGEKVETVYRINETFRQSAKTLGFEIYPKRKKPFRLPLGQGQNPIDEKYKYLKTWEEKLYWLKKLDEYDISHLKHQMQFDFKPKKNILLFQPDFENCGAELLDSGLQQRSSRDWAQFEIIKHLWRENFTMEAAAYVLWNWIVKKNNGYSYDFKVRPEYVRDHQRRQIVAYYTYRKFHYVLPDSTHNSFVGYLTEPDMTKIINLCEGSLPRMRFVTELVKHFNPRRHRDSVPVHSSDLIKWGSNRTYIQHLNWLESKGVLKRGTRYLAGGFKRNEQTGEVEAMSKEISLNWPYASENKAIKHVGRSVETFEQAIKSTFSPRNLQAILNFYLKPDTSRKMIYRIFESVKQVGTNA